MGKVEIKDKTLYYKTLRLKSEAIEVVLQEKSDWAEGKISIGHSPVKFDRDHLGWLEFKSLQAFKDYVAMLEQFLVEFEAELAKIPLRPKPKSRSK